MTKECAKLYEQFMKECTYYTNEDIEDTAKDFSAWLKKRVKNDQK